MTDSNYVRPILGLLSLLEQFHSTRLRDALNSGLRIDYLPFPTTIKALAALFGEPVSAQPVFLARESPMTRI